MPYALLRKTGSVFLLSVTLTGSMFCGSANAAASLIAPKQQLASGEVPIVRAREPIKHLDGRIRYIVDLVDDRADRPAKFENVGAQISFQKIRSATLIQDLITEREVELLGTTSHVGVSFVAYLTENQVDQQMYSRPTKALVRK